MDQEEANRLLSTRKDSIRGTFLKKSPLEPTCNNFITGLIVLATFLFIVMTLDLTGAIKLTSIMSLHKNDKLNANLQPFNITNTLDQTSTKTLVEASKEENSFLKAKNDHLKKDQSTQDDLSKKQLKENTKSKDLLTSNEKTHLSGQDSKKPILRSEPISKTKQENQKEIEVEQYYEPEPDYLDESTYLPFSIEQDDMEMQNANVENNLEADLENNLDVENNLEADVENNLDADVENNQEIIEEKHQEVEVQQEIELKNYPEVEIQNIPEEELQDNEEVQINDTQELQNEVQEEEVNKETVVEDIQQVEQSQEAEQNIEFQQKNQNYNQDLDQTQQQDSETTDNMKNDIQEQTIIEEQVVFEQIDQNQVEYNQVEQEANNEQPQDNQVEIERIYTHSEEKQIFGKLKEGRLASTSPESNQVPTKEHVILDENDLEDQQDKLVQPETEQNIQNTVEVEKVDLDSFVQENEQIDAQIINSDRDPSQDVQLIPADKDPSSKYLIQMSQNYRGPEETKEPVQVYFNEISSEDVVEQSKEEPQELQIEDINLINDNSAPQTFNENNEVQIIVESQEDYQYQIQSTETVNIGDSNQQAENQAEIQFLSNLDTPTESQSIDPNQSNVVTQNEDSNALFDVPQNNEIQNDTTTNNQAAQDFLSNLDILMEKSSSPNENAVLTDKDSLNLGYIETYSQQYEVQKSSEQSESHSEISFIQTDDDSITKDISNTPDMNSFNEPVLTTSTQIIEIEKGQNQNQQVSVFDLYEMGGY